jgi:curli production assembly/transport component CsgF
VNRISRTLIIAAGLACAASYASASSLVYTPTNPTFGGNPANGANLLAQAQAQGLGTQAGQNSPNLSGLLNGIGAAIGNQSMSAPSTPNTP